jgi:hypothetical protein
MRLIPLPLPLLLLIYSSFSNRVLAKPEIALPFGEPSAGPCISQGDQTVINELFSDGMLPFLISLFLLVERQEEADHSAARLAVSLLSLAFGSVGFGSGGGPGKKVKICPGTTLKLSGPIIFTGKDQELSTEGYPKDDSRAKLVLVDDAVTAVQ